MALFAIVHFYSLKIKETMVTLTEETLTFKDIAKDVWIFVPPILVLVIFLVKGDSPSQAILYSMVAMLIMSLLKWETCLGYNKILKAFADAAFDSLTVTGACAAAGIISGVVLLTGLGIKIGDFVFYFSSGHLYLALPFIMLASLVLDMGLPTLICYILLAVTTAPPLIKMGIPPMPAHMFIFYFGMLSMVTPPVAMAAYAAALLLIKPGWITDLVGICMALIMVAFQWQAGKKEAATRSGRNP
jgi:TRAP-type uncharacterized transport system fused permease subunit